MKVVNIHAAKTNLSRLIEEAVAGEPFIIAKAGKPLVEVKRLESNPKKPRVGFALGRYKIPDDFNTMMADEIEEMFYGPKRRKR
ncbi:MAG: type II toxin-antitoxin system prevent-host-death family antitoxin [Acidobacteria bacterium]|nr:MAG: type II toxin-antitoxin system prevent-host-death family antitoxin [Acidobacteriota bacterium]